MAVSGCCSPDKLNIIELTIKFNFCGLFRDLHYIYVSKLNWDVRKLFLGGSYQISISCPFLSVLYGNNFTEINLDKYYVPVSLIYFKPNSDGATVFFDFCPCTAHDIIVSS